MRVTLYSKPGCHLCEDVKADLQTLSREIGFMIEERNVEADVVDYARFRYLIPVVDVEDGPMLYAPIEYVALRHALMNARVAQSKADS